MFYRYLITRFRKSARHPFPNWKNDRNRHSTEILDAESVFGGSSAIKLKVRFLVRSD